MPPRAQAHDDVAAMAMSLLRELEDALTARELSWYRQWGGRHDEAVDARSTGVEARALPDGPAHGVPPRPKGAQ